MAMVVSNVTAFRKVTIKLYLRIMSGAIFVFQSYDKLIMDFNSHNSEMVVAD